MIKRRVSTFWACPHHWPISERGASAQYGEGAAEYRPLLSGLSTPRPGGGDSAGGETVR